MPYPELAALDSLETLSILHDIVQQTDNTAMAHCYDRIPLSFKLLIRPAPHWHALSSRQHHLGRICFSSPQGRETGAGYMLSGFHQMRLLSPPL